MEPTITHDSLYSSKVERDIAEPRLRKIYEKTLGRANGIKEIFNIVPTIDYPKNAFFYRPCLEWLHSKGIYFKNEVKEN